MPAEIGSTIHGHHQLLLDERPGIEDDGKRPMALIWGLLCPRYSFVGFIVTSLVGEAFLVAAFSLASRVSPFAHQPAGWGIGARA